MNMKETYKLIARNASGKTGAVCTTNPARWRLGSRLRLAEPPPSSCNSVGAIPATFTSSAFSERFSFSVNRGLKLIYIIDHSCCELVSIYVSRILPPSPPMSPAAAAEAQVQRRGEDQDNRQHVHGGGGPAAGSGGGPRPARAQRADAGRVRHRTHGRPGRHQPGELPELQTAHRSETPTVCTAYRHTCVFPFFRFYRLIQGKL